jgi:hypothetical protein
VEESFALIMSHFSEMMENSGTDICDTLRMVIAEPFILWDQVCC